MASVKELEQELADLKSLLSQLGLVPSGSRGDAQKQTDYVAFGSPQHAALIGLCPIETAEEAESRIIWTSTKTGRLYCLEDEIAAMNLIPGVTLQEAATVILRQKVNTFEAGPPKVPESAPPMWTPTANPMEGIR